MLERIHKLNIRFFLSSYVDDVSVIFFFYDL